MNEFIEKWKNDKKYQAKIKLSLYTIFIILVTIFALPKENISITEIEEQKEPTIEQNNKKTIIEIPTEYNYTINININENEYQYIGTKTKEKEIITKEVNHIKTNYIYNNNNYYKEINNNYILTTKEDVYDIVESNYLALETLNKYLEQSTKENNQYIIYLKDIILNNESNDYIIITIDNNIIKVDYTKLMNILDETFYKYNIEINIEKE